MPRRTRGNSNYVEVTRLAGNGPRVMSEPLLWDSEDPNLTWDSPLPISWDGLLPNLNNTHTMSEQNRISIAIAAADKTAYLTKAAELRAIVMGFAQNLSATDRQVIPTIGTERGAMVATFNMHMAARPEFVPSFVNMTEKDKDVAGFSDVVEMLAPLKELVDLLADTAHVLGADLLVAYLAFYGNVQLAAKNKVPGADVVLADLKRFFTSGGQNPQNPPMP